MAGTVADTVADTAEDKEANAALAPDATHADYSVLVKALEKVAEAVVEELGRHLNVSWASNRGIFGYPWATFGAFWCRRQRS